MKSWLATPAPLNEDGYRIREIPTWSAWTSGLVLVAGILHLTALPAHLLEARGTGFYFFAIGAGQTVWAGLFLVHPTRAKARIGLTLLAVAPLALWLMTRTMRSPWGGGPEAMDFVSIATVALQAVAAAVLIAARLGQPQPEPSIAGQRVLTGAVVLLVVLGAAVGAASYGGAIAAEATIPWLGEPEADHHEGMGQEAAEGDEDPPHPH